MIKILAVVAILGSVANISSLAVAQDRQDEAFTTEVLSVIAKKNAQCAHRRIMPPDPNDDCADQLRSAAQTGYGQGGISANASGAGAGIGPGNGGGRGNGIGPGSGGGRGLAIGPGSGGGQGRGRQ